METTTTTSTVTPKTKFNPGSAGFLLAVLLFLLPFVQIRCNDQLFASNTGVGLALGINYKTNGQVEKEDNLGDTLQKKVTEIQNGKVYISALIALLLGTTGFILSIVKPGRVNIFIGSAAAICLIILMIQIQMDIRETPTRRAVDNLGNAIKIRAVFTAWYYISLIGFIVAAFFSFRKIGL